MSPRTLLSLLVVGAIAAAGYVAPASAALRPARIVGGTAATPDTAPWTAFLIPPEVPSGPFEGAQYCGAAVASPTAVVTAAHCVVDRHRIRSFEVVTGRTTLSSEDGQRLQVSSVEVDPRYTTPGVRDAAIVHLATPTLAPAIGIATRSQAGLAAPGSRLLLTGWGLLRNNDFAIPDTLMQASIRAASGRRCTAVYGRVFKPKEMICTAPGKPAPCHGDSGSPLVSLSGGTPTLVGIVAFGGEPCATRRLPSVYTRVSFESAFLARALAQPPPTPPSGG
jgi:secreted trypsin-like serine protease